jgi:[ribosomal protein S18]-alanine N-acetyltransferase
MGTETSGEPLIREAAAKDAHAIYEIGTECFTDAWHEETVAADLSKPHSAYLVAEKNGAVVGYACSWYVVDEAQLVNIGVSKKERRRGMADLLMKALLAEAKARGMVSIYLEVRTSNVAAQALYRKYGFTVKALRKGVYDLPKEDGFIMGRPLARDPVS